MSPGKKIPTKSELIRLQKLHRTDERIGEYLGGVPAYLVAYWRRKKNVPKYSQPKFSEREIRDLWERFGDDDKCGLELGISKAAYYNWRRRYEIREKPAFLKLEQLEFNFPGLRPGQHVDTLFGQQTVFQKILARAAGIEKAEAGQKIEIEPNLVVVNEQAGKVIEEFHRLGAEYVWNPSRIVISLTNHVGPVPAESISDPKLLRKFAKRQGIRNFYDIREGIYHQVVLEKGHILPGDLQVSSGRRSSSYGCVGALSQTLQSAQMAQLWTTGKTEITVPGAIRVDLNGRRPVGVYTKDIALHLIKKLSATGASGKVIEYLGPAVSHMSISERFTLSNMAVEMGASSAICPFDSVTRRYLTSRTNNSYRATVSDKDAVYDEMYQINIDQLTPQLSCPGGIDKVRSVVELEELPVSLIILGTCANGRFDDLRVAAELLKGKMVHSDCRLLIIPGSRTVYLEALKKGLIRVFIEAGAIVTSPGCWSCCGERQRVVGPGERCLSTSNSCLTNSIATSESEVYLCSPATAAVSAVSGQITDPTRFVG